jgi:hypothetical protein
MSLQYESDVKISVFLYMTLSRLVCEYQRFGGTYCLHHHGGRLILDL